MIVVSDTTAISNLYQIGIIEILEELYEQVIISPGVHRELSRVQEQAQLLDTAKWIIVKYPENQTLISELLENLDLGESESITLALELNADYLIIDEKLGREVAANYGIRITGILGVLIKAKKSGLIDNVKDYIIKLQEVGLWLNESLISRVLRSLGEID